MVSTLDVTYNRITLTLGNVLWNYGVTVVFKPRAHHALVFCLTQISCCHLCHLAATRLRVCDSCRVLAFPQELGAREVAATGCAPAPQPHISKGWLC